MKKFGFTLSELLITVGIVGVVAALTAPAVSNIMPDRNKMMFMKNYKELTTITEKLLQDPELYYTTYTLDADGKKVPTCIGLSCYNAPLREPFKSASDCADKGKYIALLKYMLGDTSLSDYNYYLADDKTRWIITKPGESASSGEEPQWYTSVNFIVNYTKMADACIHGDSNCKKPNKFSFSIDKYGNVTPVDNLSKAYLLNPNNMNNKKKDFACAAAIKADTAGKAPADICAELDD